MNIDKYYPSEIVQRIRDLPERNSASMQQRRILDILCDQEVARKARHVFKKIQNSNHAEDELQRLDEFWNFIEIAASLPDIRPPGARWHQNGYAEFFTPEEIRSELTELKKAGDLFCSLLKRRSNLVLFDHLEELINLLDAFLTSPQIANTPQCRSLPNQGKSAGKNNWRNHLLKQLSHVAELRLGERFPAFIVEVLRVLLASDEPLEASTAREILGSKTSLVRAI